MILGLSRVTVTTATPVPLVAVYDTHKLRDDAGKQRVNKKWLPNDLSSHQYPFLEEPKCPKMNDEVASRNSPSVVVISGGTAANSLVFAFQGLAGTSQLTYVLPIRYLQRSNETDCSDNGGSTSEISRVIGGPGIGDIRSRLVRLMNENTPEQAAIKKLMSHRLAIDDETLARMEWLEIVEGTHRYFSG